MTPSKHVHPKPNQDRLTQYGALALAAVMLLCVPLLMLLTATGAPGGLFIVAGIVLFLLIPPVLMLTALSPAVTLQDDGLTASPRIWPERFILWDEVQAVKEYPLLPNESQEVNRRNFVGRRNYTPADGFMLVIPKLPLPYRIAAFFAGEGGKGIIVLTNRTHTDYDHLKKQVIRRKGKIQPHA